MSKNTYWHKYFPFFNADAVHSVVKEIKVDFGGFPAEADIYTCSPDAPTVVFIHGIGLYARFCAPICYNMYERGYNVLAINLPGHYESDQKGHFPIADCIDAIKDAVDYAREQFNDTVFLAGGSFGGALSYYAAAAGVKVKALVSYSIFDMSNRKFVKSYAKERKYLGMFRHILQVLCKFIPHKKLAMRQVFGKGVFRRGYPENWEGFNMFRDDKNLTSDLTIQTYADLAKCKPAKKYHEFDGAPIRVIYPTQERLFDSGLMKKAYDQITAIKDLVILEQDHWPVYEQQIRQTANAICDWFDKWLPPVMSPAQVPVA
jgi:alpha-beta hydrolase superfamily lysophospholipase